MYRDSATLSYVPSNLTDPELREKVQYSLKAYVSQGSNNKTFRILNTFLQFLPHDGANNIGNDIVECHSNEAIRQIAASPSTGLLSTSA